MDLMKGILEASIHFLNFVSVSKKGWSTLEGAKVELFEENPCRLQVIFDFINPS